MACATAPMNGGCVGDRVEHHEIVDGLVVAHGREPDASLATAKLRPHSRSRYWTIGPDHSRRFVLPELCMRTLNPRIRGTGVRSSGYRSQRRIGISSERVNVRQVGFTLRLARKRLMTLGPSLMARSPARGMPRIHWERRELPSRSEWLV
jgi:hypothetical protein